MDIEQRIVLGFLLGALAFGCQQAAEGEHPESGEPSTEQGGEVLSSDDKVVREVAFAASVGETQMTTRQPATFNVAFLPGKEPKADLSWAVSDGNSLVVQAPYELFRTKELKVALGDAPNETGVVATLMLDGEMVRSGALVLKLSNGRLQGSCDEQELSFDGSMVTSCASDRTGGNSDGQVLEDDPDFSSEDCASVRTDGF